MRRCVHDRTTEIRPQVRKCDDCGEEMSYGDPHL